MAKAPKTPPPESTKEHATIARGEGGRFLPGVSGNPGGRPGIADEIANLAKADSPEAYAKVARIMRDDDHRQQLAAALAILKVAGVLRAVEEQTPAKPPASHAYADATTDELLKRAGVTATPIPN